MSRFLQLHFLTAYPPSNPNRDDTGRPKTAQFGGTTRLRLSSQALKRAWRTSELLRAKLAGNLGERTQRIGRAIEQDLIASGRSPDAARAVARQVADIFGKLKPEADASPTDTEQLAFIAPEERTAALSLAQRIAGGVESFDEKKTPALVLRTADTAVDVAMFGRMLADDPDYNREAAVQVAHAITTHKVMVEDDYYTAVDDLKGPAEDAGAGFIGEAGFGSGLFYLYACVDRALLIRNLGGDAELAARGIAALIEAAATEAPRGKQNSFASRPRCLWAMAERGDAAPRTLAAAFFEAIEGRDLLGRSVEAILAMRGRIAAAYDDDPAHLVMDVIGGDGTLQALVAFATAADHG